MANRTFNQFGGTLERKVIKLFAKIKYSGGAPVLVTQEIINAGTSPVTVNPSQGIQSLVNDNGIQLFLGSNNGGTQTAIGGSTTLFTTTGTGVPTYDPYVRLLNVTAVGIPSSLPPTAIVNNVFVVQDNVNGAAGNPFLKIIVISNTVGAGTLSPIVPPDDGTVLLLEITLSNTTAY